MTNPRQHHGPASIRGRTAVSNLPGPDSYFGREAGVIKFARGRISEIVSLDDNTERGQYQLEPQLITSLFDHNYEKRRLLKFADIPRVLIDAVTSVEDKRFFQHQGFDPLRIVKAVYVDLKQGRKEQGASTSEPAARARFVARVKRNVGHVSWRNC